MTNEYDNLNMRIENDLVAYGNFTSNDIINNSICQTDFTEIGEPESANPGIKKQEKRSNITQKSVWDQQDEQD